MKPSNTEKLIIAMLCDIMKQQGSSTGFDPDFIHECVGLENEWAIEWQYPGVFGSSADKIPAEVIEVCDILGMYSHLKYSFDNLIPADQSVVRSNASVGKSGVGFPGFDGNNESSQMIIVKLLIDQMGRFTDLQSSTYNSHCPMLDKYRRQLDEYRKIASNGSSQAGANGIVSVLNA